MPADIVSPPDRAAFEHRLQRTDVILDEQPVAHLLAAPYTGSGSPPNAFAIISGISFSGK